MITILLQLFLCFAIFIAAVNVSFQLQLLRPLQHLIPKSGKWRILQSILFWIAFVINLGGIKIPFLAFFGAVIALGSAISVLVKAVRSNQESLWLLPTLVIFLSILISLLQPLGLKVMALPKAADLPSVIAPWKVVKTYDEGLWFEGIAAGDDGTLYLSGNRYLDFSRSDYYHVAQGELIARNQNGKEEILFKTEKGHTSGVPYIANDHSIYLNSHGDTSSIWRVNKNTRPFRLAQFPKGAWPNGLDQGPDGMLYAADSRLGIIWRIDIKTGHVEEALRDPILLARPFISLAPGANGLHFRGQELLVTVSDRTTVLSFHLDTNGKLGKAKILASGIPGDDFAIGHDGSLFITTHPYNTVVRVFPNGKRIIIGKLEQHINGPTDAVFGKLTNDHQTLYVVTDGGAFTGGPNTRGELIAVEPYQ